MRCELSHARTAMARLPSARHAGKPVWRVLVPAARSGIVASVILGMGRALGETMAVIMMLGNALQVPHSLLDSTTTLTSNIGLELAYASGQHRQALFATGVVLFLLIMVAQHGREPADRRRSAQARGRRRLTVQRSAVPSAGGST